MIIRPTPVEGLFEIWPERHEDERGFFARTSCVDEFAAAGLPADWSQCSVSWNAAALTLRGLHYQCEPYTEHKLVRCTAGRIFDVVVDLRPSSETFCQWYSLEMSAANLAAFYISPGLAHGFLTLEEGSEVFYQIRGPYVSEAARGVRWNDPALKIQWPAPPKVISKRDANFALMEQKTPR